VNFLTLVGPQRRPSIFLSMAVSLEDVQNQVPTLHVSLSRVGVTNVEKVIRIESGGREQLFYAKLDCFVDLGPRQKGAHMSRFEEVVNDAIGEVILGESAFRAETLAQHIAEKVRDRQGARSTSRRPTAASARRRSTRCTGSRSPARRARSGSSVSRRRA
jgi:GTP cyclohydrolase-4